MSEKIGEKMSGPKIFHRQQQFALRNRLPMWVVYNPTTADFPGQWIARMHLSLPEPVATDLIIVGETREAVRRQLPEGLTNIGRQACDEPVIEEVWI